MNLGSIPRRRARWAVPSGAVCAVGVVVAATTMASAHSAPSLPHRSVTQLLAGVQAAAARPPAPMTATVQETLSLGLPSLPSAAGLNNPFGELTGTHQFGIWYASPDKFRLAEQVQLGETDLRRNGSQVWLWSSRSQTATHVLLPRQASMQGQNGSEGQGGSRGPGGFQPVPSGPLNSPAAIRALLAAAGRSTVIKVGPNVTVAGQAAYQLVIMPKTSKSLIGRIVIAIDAARHIPLQFEIFARGGTQPAVQIGYTSLSFGTPAASNFTFSPPAGAKVRTVKVASVLPLAALASPTGMLSWQFARQHQAQVKITVTGPAKLRPGSLRRLLKRLLRKHHGKLMLSQRVSVSATAQVPGTYESQLRALSIPAPLVATPQVIGKGWLTVLRTPPLGIQLPGLHASTSSFTAVSPSNIGVGSPSQAGPELALLRRLVAVATPVHGSWGSGRLLRTSLVSVLFTSGGQVLIGAVTPSVLYADAAG